MHRRRPGRHPRTPHRGVAGPPRDRVVPPRSPPQTGSAAPSRTSTERHRSRCLGPSPCPNEPRHRAPPPNSSSSPDGSPSRANSLPKSPLLCRQLVGRLAPHHATTCNNVRRRRSRLCVFAQLKGPFRDSSRYLRGEEQVYHLIERIVAPLGLTRTAGAPPCRSLMALPFRL
jgi:hypothetical protein